MPRLLLVLTALLALPAIAQPTIERVEPAFWWSGMVHSELQVLVYGDDLARARVTLDAYPGVTLRETVAVESPNYVFLTLDLAPDVQPGTL
ncbi:MAG: cyclomaltodextrinase N-terminal domain-containing protein, partial [Bacteroidota bacterium]